MAKIHPSYKINLTFIHISHNTVLLQNVVWTVLSYSMIYIFRRLWHTLWHNDGGCCKWRRTPIPFKNKRFCQTNTGARGHSCNCMDHSQKGIYFSCFGKTGRHVPRRLRYRQRQPSSSSLQTHLVLTFEWDSQWSSTAHVHRRFWKWNSHSFWHKLLLYKRKKKKNHVHGFQSRFPLLDAILTTFPCSRDQGCTIWDSFTKPLHYSTFH